MKFNSIVVPPVLQWPYEPTNAEISDWFEVLDAMNRGERSLPKNVLVTPAIETHIRTMIEHCALKVSIVGKLPAVIHSAQSPSTSLSPSIRRVLEFSDRRGTTWNAVEEFFEPIYSDIRPIEQDMEFYDFSFGQLFEDTFNICMAYKRSAEALVLPTRTVQYIDHLTDSRKLSGESLARLARLRGVFALYVRTEIPSFICTDIGAITFSERIEEILEDAYLLEASRLRRFFGLGANLASTRRRYRQLMQTIQIFSKSVKGLLAIVNQGTFLPEEALAVGGALSEIVPNLPVDATAPRLFSPYEVQYKSRQLLVRAVRIPYREPVQFMNYVSHHYESLNRIN